MHDMSRCAYKLHLSNPHSCIGLSGENILEIFFVRNCIDCPEIYRKFMFATLNLWGFKMANLLGIV